MVLVADAGNTNVKLAVFEDESLLALARIPTEANRRPEAYMEDIRQVLRNCQIRLEDITDIAVSTVVPGATAPFLLGMRQLFVPQPLLVNSDTDTGITIQTDEPAQVGADRLVNATEAYRTYGGPVLVIDFGTATTYDLITEKGVFLGGIIAPGLEICAQALWENTERLPKVSIEKPAFVIGTNTEDSMKSGIFYGYLGQMEYLIHRVKEEQGKDLRVIATGGLSRLFLGSTTSIDVYEPQLTLRGLNYIARRNRQHQ